MQPSASKYSTTYILETPRIIVEETLAHKQTSSAIDIKKILSMLLFDIKLLEQNVFNIVTLSFDDNKVLKVQLDKLIFVQVCRIID